MTAAAHVGSMKLRQLRSGELTGDELAVVSAHADACADCRGKLNGLATEQAQFQEQISFDRFAAGVERAALHPKTKVSAPQPAARRWIAPMLAMAASLLAVLAANRALLDPTREYNRLKGGAAVELKIANSAGNVQRVAPQNAPALLSPGDRVRIGYRAGAHKFVLALSVDAQGTVTPLYPERGHSLDAQGNALTYLPESLEFTGSGQERLVVVLSDQALSVDQVRAAARAAFDAAQGDVSQLPDLDVPGEQFHRMVQKP